MHEQKVNTKNADETSGQQKNASKLTARPPLKIIGINLGMTDDGQSALTYLKGADDIQVILEGVEPVLRLIDFIHERDARSLLYWAAAHYGLPLSSLADRPFVSREAQ